MDYFSTPSQISGKKHPIGNPMAVISIPLPRGKIEKAYEDASDAASNNESQHRGHTLKKNRSNTRENATIADSERSWNGAADSVRGFSLTGLSPAFIGTVK